jgi:hypothetical protein
MTGALGARVQLGVLKVIVWLYSSLAAAFFPGRRRLPFGAYRVLLRTVVRYP